MGRGAREARVADDQRRVVLLLGLQHVQQRDGMRLGRVAADDEDGLGIVDVVVAVGHGAVAPCVGHTRHGGRVTDPGLVIHVVRAPIGGKLAEQIGLFVGMLGRSQPVDAVRSAFLADLHHAVADLVDRLFPADALPLATLFLHRVFQAALAMRVFAHRGALGAMGTQVERAVPAGLLPHPDTVLHFGHDGTADRTVGADRLHGLNRIGGGGGGAGAAHRSSGCADCGKATDGQAAAPQERAAVDARGCGVRQDTCPLGASRYPVGLFPKHCNSSLCADQAARS